MNQCIKTVKLENQIKSKSFLMHLLQVVIGSLFLSLISIFKIPFYPTPTTLQTYGVFILPIFLGPKRGSLAVILYLLQASCGWPVLAGGNSNPLWMLGPNAGFLLGFPLAAYVIGYLHEKIKIKTFLRTLTVVVCGQMIVYLSGLACLSFYFGFQKAIVYGLVPFLITMPIKILLVSLTYKAVSCFKK